MANPFIVRDLPCKDLPSPYRSIIAISNSVDSNPNAGIRGGSRNMSPVVLDRNKPSSPFLSQLTSIPGGKKLGMGIVGDQIIRFCTKEPAHSADGLLQVVKSPGIPDVSNVGGGGCNIIFVDGDIGIQFRTDRKYRALSQGKSG